LGLSSTADFQFHLGSWLDIDSAGSMPTVPAIENLHGLPIQCVRGQLEDDSACPTIAAGVAQKIIVPGGHHFDRNAPLIAGVVLRGLKV
jgi:type IV secretory pathway VirJ component